LKEIMSFFSKLYNLCKRPCRVPDSLRGPEMSRYQGSLNVISMRVVHPS
jgi:hypothetical protein